MHDGTEYLVSRRTTRPRHDTEALIGSKQLTMMSDG
jgi:hypothetical protein